MLFVEALLIALIVGLIGGLYPAYRATRILPQEALRYE
jgi:putative ABC transport system permease protein